MPATGPDNAAAGAPAPAPSAQTCRRLVSVVRRLLGVDDCAQPGASALGYIEKRDPDLPLVLERHLRDPHHSPVGANRVLPQFGIELEQQSGFHGKKLGGGEPNTALAEVGRNQVPDAIAIPGRLLDLLRAYRAVEWNSRVSPSLVWTTLHRDLPPVAAAGALCCPAGFCVIRSRSSARQSPAGAMPKAVLSGAASRSPRARTGGSLNTIKQR